MATQVPPKINTVHTFYVSLASQASSHVMQANPTLATGDVKVAIDDGAPANLATLPVVDADFTKRVKVELSAGEMNGDNITIIFSDAAGAEWDDLVLNLQTTARQIDDLAYPTVSGRSLDVSAGGEAGIDWANVGSPTTALNLSGTNIDADQAVASVSGAVGSVTGAVGSVTGNVGGNVVGSVASVTAPVTAGTVSDKTGYALSGAGVTAVQSGLSTLNAAQVNAEVIDVLTVDTFAEVTSAPAATSSLKDKIGWLFKLARNLRKTTSTTDSVYNDAGAVVDSTSAVSDDTVTFTRGEYS